MEDRDGESKADADAQSWRLSSRKFGKERDRNFAERKEDLLRQNWSKASRDGPLEESPTDLGEESPAQLTPGPVAWIFRKDIQGIHPGMLLALVICILLAAGYGFSYFYMTSPAASPPSTSLEEARAALVEFYRCRSPEEQLDWIRKPEDYAGKLRAHYARHRFSGPTEISELSSEDLLAKFGGTHVRFRIQLEPSKELRTVWVENTDQGMKVDWETAIAYQEINWNTFKREKPDKIYRLRALASESEHYASEYEDETTWKCFHLTCPYTHEELFAYAKRGTPAEQTAARLIAKATSGPFRGIFWVRFRPGTLTSNLVELVRPPSAGWLYDPRLESEP